MFSPPWYTHEDRILFLLTQRYLETVKWAHYLTLWRLLMQYRNKNVFERFETGLDHTYQTNNLHFLISLCFQTKFKLWIKSLSVQFCFKVVNAVLSSKECPLYFKNCQRLMFMLSHLQFTSGKFCCITSNSFNLLSLCSVSFWQWQSGASWLNRLWRTQPDTSLICRALQKPCLGSFS